MQEWFTPQEILDAQSPLVPNLMRTLQRYIQTQDFRADKTLARKRTGKGGGWEYHLSAWPNDVQNRLLAKQKLDAHHLTKKEDRENSDLWRRYEKLSDKQKEVCSKRLKAVKSCIELWRSGIEKQVAAAMVAKEFGISVSTYFNWERMTHGIHECDWLAAFAPNHVGRTKKVECNPDAWKFIVADFLRREHPSFASCYRRLTKAAALHDWSPIPVSKTLERRIYSEFSASEIKYARYGKEKLNEMFPFQTRTVAHMEAMEACNMDGHKLDIFVKLLKNSASYGKRSKDHLFGRVIICVAQDLYSGKILAHRIDVSEHKNLVRLTIGDMLKEHGIPKKMYLDNGKAFASKDITGGVKHRNRFKIKPEEPNGLLTNMGVETTFVNPYAGRSKPIERVFKGWADDIAKHPAFAGAWTGNHIDNKPENYMSKAIDLDVVEQIVAECIEEHNARVGRKSEVCDGRSFDQAFEQSIEAMALPPRRPTPAQERFWLLAAENIRTKENGEIHIMGNRYWIDDLADFGRQLVTVRFDPQDLTKSVFVYEPKGSLICEAPVLGVVQFDNVDGARESARKRRNHNKAIQKSADAKIEWNADQLARLLKKPSSEDDKPTPKNNNNVRHAVFPKNNQSALRKPVQNVSEWNDDAQEAFGKAIGELQPNASNILNLPKRK